MNFTRTSKKEIVAWILYDFASAPYFVVILTFVFATYFSKSIANNVIEGTALWGYTTSASALLIAIASPILGAIGDYGGHHKRWLYSFTYLGILTTACLWFAYPNPSSIFYSLLCIFISNFALEVATVFYNAYLPGIAPKAYLGRISGWAWGSGYLGGIICLIIALYVLIEGSLGTWLGRETLANVRAVPLLVAIWLIIFSLPLLFIQTPEEPKLGARSAIKKGLQELILTLRGLPQRRSLLLFLISRIIYMDGLNTVFALGGIYAAGTFKLSVSEVVLFGIIINLTAGIGAGIFAWIDDWIGSKKTILISLLCLLFTYCFLLSVESVQLFWVSAPILGIFVGPIQSASRTFLSRLAEPEEITRMYGLYALTGKITSFLGPLLVGIFTSVYNSQRVGMAVLIPFFLVGGGILLFVNE
ncbi:Vacuole effluxer Atg22 like protein [Legionella massiliensis]|uniref:Vacuole effluxer Atg22 like protein n=1 Tax=Legionella massiliensis TaxID=1034943 RepID=A0A078L2H9_9GAMM|nr:MFS transporter [Legionella massiliensis]CDZ78208.1 Vacuole effluxer Atg22 like protein [Legionella massiliensis]CEE13946.1 Vacuole effluxer Atg22 like protein [Legionella massiliensis]